MPKPQHTKDGFRELIGNMNDTAASKLSHRKLYSEMKSILAKNRGEWGALFIEYIKKTNLILTAKSSLYRSMCADNKAWSQDYADYLQFGSTRALKESIRIFNYCLNLFDIKGQDKFELTEADYTALRDWQQEQIKPHTEYAEYVRMMNKWDKKTVNDSLADVEDSVGISANDPSQIKRYGGAVATGTDSEIASVYCKMVVFREELAKHNILWKWFFSSRVEVYNTYINRAKALLEKVGFKESEHGADAINYAKTSLFQTYSRDVDDVDTWLKESIETYKQNHMPQLTVASDHLKQAYEFNRKPELSIGAKLSAYGEKYGVEPASLDNERLDWRSVAEKYDKRRETESFTTLQERMFLTTLTKLFKKAAENQGENMNVADVIKDAREISVIVTQFYSIAYSVEEFTKAAMPHYLKNITPDFFKARMKTFLNGTSITEEAKERLAAEGAGVISELRENPEQIKREDRELAAKHAHPEINNSVKENVTVIIPNENDKTELSPKVNNDPQNVKQNSKSK